MNALFFATLVCVGAVVAANPWGHNDDGQWKGEGLAESQDHGQWSHGHGVDIYGAGIYGSHAHGVYAHGAAPIGHNGVVVDTPEVAHAKAAHFSAIAAASHGAHGVYGAHVHGYGVPSVYAAHGVYAHGLAPLAHDGVVVDTPEVAHAKIAHASAVARLSHGIAGSHGVYGGLAHGVHGGLAHGVYGVPSIHGAHGVHAHGPAPLAHDGVVVDTHEVAHAKIAHASAVARLSHGIAGSHGVYGGLAHGVYGVPSIHGAHGVYAHGAAPLGHNGVVVDTPEVAHAKAAHYSAVAAASHGAHHGAHHYGSHGQW